jgi:hypothetical protein
MLAEPLIALLNRMQFCTDAKRLVSILPLGSIYWDDEMPNYRDLMKLSEDERFMMWRLFGIRLRVWDNEELAPEDKSLWDAGRSEAPDWALFRRTALSSVDRKAREEAEKDVEAQLEGFFQGADQVELRDRGGGVQEFSATFDLTKRRTEG